jgi:hypothetical protein
MNSSRFRRLPEHPSKARTDPVGAALPEADSTKTSLLAGRLTPPEEPGSPPPNVALKTAARFPKRRPLMPCLPTGTVTFFFTDIEGSTISSSCRCACS